MSPLRVYVAIAIAAVAAALHLALAPVPVPVLLIHDVNPHRAPIDFWTLAPERFLAVLDAIDRAGLHGIGLDEAEAYLAGHLPRARAAEAVLITVDDGCASAATRVAPELARRGHRAAFFVVTGWTPPEHLSADQVRELARAGHDVGSHSVTHASLIAAPRADPAREAARIAAELADSRARLSAFLGRPVRSIAYPKGDWDARTVELVRQAGYALAFTTDIGYLAPGGEPLSIPRLQLNWDTPLAWVEDYLTAPRRERARNLFLTSMIAALALAAAFIARPRRLD